MNDYKARLFDEHRELNNRIEKLTSFILSDDFDAQASVDKNDLIKQLNYMGGYSSILSCRVSRQCGDA